MTDGWPDFDEPIRLDAERCWTAQFDSYDQRNEAAYYRVTLHEAGAEIGRLMAEVSLWAVPVLNWADPVLYQWLLDEVYDVVATGTSNTTYRGYPGPFC